MSRSTRRLSFGERRAALDAARIPAAELLTVTRNILDVTAQRAGRPAFRHVNRCAIAIALHCLARLQALDCL